MPLSALLRRPDAPRSGLPENFALVVAGAEHPVTLKRSPRARRFTLRVKPGTGEIVLTVPIWARIGEARAFANRHADWVAHRLASAESRHPFVPGTLVPLRGVPHRIVHRPGARGVVWVEQGGDGVAELHASGEEEFLARRLVDYFKAEARRDLAQAVARFSARLGRPARRVTVRDQTTRWGSCSATGVLSFSWRLILAPPFVLDYLAAHEVAHLKEMNHGPRFWRTLRDLFPETEKAQAWMRTYGAELHDYGPAAGARPPADAA